ncbi:MAG: alanine racemase [Cyclobacteriaceae bacterium]|nr:alanine racemase [Cyclobacteriaceae bacterium]MCH8517413.1 alanine racemase [Cyclobacteriaceae bacterium]
MGKNFHTSQLKLSKSAVANNIRFIKSLLGDKTIYSPVIKGNAYGHDIETFVPLLERNGIGHLSVFSADEAYRVCQVKKQGTRLMIMGQILDDQCKWAIEEGVEVYAFELERLQILLATAKKIGKQVLLHIEVETGMNRLGFQAKEIPQVIQLLDTYQGHYEFEGLCTHFAGSESIANYLRIKNQIKRYEEVYQEFFDAGFTPKLRHTACSAAVISYPETHMDMVRVGILTYGFWPSKETFIAYLQKNGMNTKDPLRRVISWSSTIMATKTVDAGEFIGYGMSYQATQAMHLAVVPVGYAYGFTRSLSNMGRVLIKGKRVPIIGIVNMNLLIADISALKDVAKNDEVVLIGKQRNNEISVAAFGELTNQPNYELLTRLPESIPRVVVR